MLCGLGLCAQLFQSTLPTRGSDVAYYYLNAIFFLFQSTLPTRGSDEYFGDGAPVVGVSIHAPHEGERLYYVTSRDKKQEVSIHAPHEGERR